MSYLLPKSYSPLVLTLFILFNSFTAGTPWIFTALPETSEVQCVVTPGLSFDCPVDTGYMSIYMRSLHYGFVILNLEDINVYDLPNNQYIHGSLFETDKYPRCSLDLNKGVWKGNSTYHMTGSFTLKGISQPVWLSWKETNLDTVNHPIKKFETQLVINNKAYGLKAKSPTTTFNITLRGTWINF